MRAMAVTPDGERTLELKAVDDAYPLPGELCRPCRRLRREAAVELIVLDRLGLAPGRASASAKALHVARHHRDGTRQGRPAEIRPRVMIGMADLAATLVQLVAWSPSDVSAETLHANWDAAPIET